MSPVRVRYLAGTVRLNTASTLRRLRGRTRRRPPCAGAVPRPRIARRGVARLELSHVLTATDLNPRYAPLWPLAKRAWSRIGEVEPMLVLVADPGAVPDELSSDPSVCIFEPEPSMSTAFQAQCIRLLYPALMQTDGAVITSDVDMVPMNPRYFHHPLRRIDRRHFVCYRDVLLPLGELPICYNAALPEIWASVFGVRDVDDVRALLRAWAEGLDYAGTHGGAGWTTDQNHLYRILLDRGRLERDVWILDDDFTGYRRLERAYVDKWGTLSDVAREGIERRVYSDYHLLYADTEHVGLNEAIIEAALVAGRPPRRTKSRSARWSDDLA